MKRAVLYIICAALLSGMSASCSKKVDVIPRATMSKIYAELFVADSWLNMGDPEDKYAADTTAFYEPIFEKFGFTTEDYLASVEYYLNDPERFARIVKKTRTMLKSDIKDLEAQLQREVDEEQAQKFRKARLEDFDAKYLVYKDFVKDAFFTDRVCMELDENGVFVPSQSQEEISYRGPKLVFKSDSLEVETPVEPSSESSSELVVPEKKKILRSLPQ